jgi:uncharacterized protein YejL (UPF0352 family)
MHRTATDLSILALGFAAAALVAAAAGARNTGVALAWGQIGFALALVYVLARR